MTKRNISRPPFSGFWVEKLSLHFWKGYITSWETHYLLRVSNTSPKAQLIKSLTISGSCLRDSRPMTFTIAQSRSWGRLKSNYSAEIFHKKREQIDYLFDNLGRSMRSMTGSWKNTGTFSPYCRARDWMWGKDHRTVAAVVNWRRTRCLSVRKVKKSDCFHEDRITIQSSSELNVQLYKLRVIQLIQIISPRGCEGEINFHQHPQLCSQTVSKE